MHNFLDETINDLPIEKYLNFKVADYAKKLSTEIGLDSNKVKEIYLGTVFHDIGKIVIPKYIVEKRGSLTNEEWKIMRTHTALGSKLLLDSIFKIPNIIALTHHEKWNGKGYPIGLKKDEIPIESRIASICDVFEALIAKRVYKEAWSLDRTVAYIVNEKGRGFEPDLVDVFINKVI